jgi:hypothetical protein
MFSTTVCFPKDPSVRCCVGSHWMTYSCKDLNKNISKEIPPQERLNLVSSKNNVVL